MTETIAALASAAGPAQRGIIRISGPASISILKTLCDTANVNIHDKRALRYKLQYHLEDDLSLPVAAHVWPTKRSFTGEPVVELHLIGSPSILNELYTKVLTRGARPAERGEFTLRAFLAGRIDLVQAEAVLGVIDAGNESELQTALSQLAGGVSGKMASAREELLLHLADLEAGLDFVEEDIDFVTRPELVRRLSETETLLSELLTQSQDRMLSTGHRKVVLAGLPNAGKSSLFNYLAKRQAAIVSAEAGTTRDYLSVMITDNEVAYELIDTAGWEDVRDGIEEAAALLRQEQFARADLVVWCTAKNISDTEFNVDRQLLELCREINPSIKETITKVDLSGLRDFAPENNSVSTETGQGIEQLQATIVQQLMESRTSAEIIGATAARCQESLEHARLASQQAQQLAELNAGDELISIELREVLQHLGRIVGKVYTDDILDRIFSRFCIGK